MLLIPPIGNQQKRSNDSTAGFCNTIRDILFDRDAYACAAYITSCVAKSSRGMSYFKQRAPNGNWDFKETPSSSLRTFATNLFFASSYCSASNRLSFTRFARERGFIAIAVLLL
jgi:hypothetical protein